MGQQSIFDLLSRVEIFAGIPVNLLEEFAGRLKVASFKSGTTIIQKGDQGDSMFVIANGRVKIHDGDHVVAETEAGNFFGEFSLLDAGTRSMSVTAITDIEALAITRELFYDLLQSQPEVAKKIISALTKRLRNQNESIINQLRTREEELTKLVDERTKELQIKNEQITVKNKEITDNVNYARRIQAAILPEVSVIQETFPESFVLYLPKDIVSGDFFSFFRNGNNAILISADCTGHGVTGAFLSVVGNSLLRQIINERKINDPGLILDNLHEEMISALNQRNNESTDGMDVAICSMDLKRNILKFAGANRPLWIIRNSELTVYNPNKFPVGGLQITHEENFLSHEIQLQPNDSVYIFSDGYADQFGGDSGKKLMTKKFKEMLVSAQHLGMKEQREYLFDYLESWKGQHEQVDDVLVIGVKVGNGSV
jgi:serine phosphatase RsbU (regulator of sigma subunit)